MVTKRVSIAAQGNSNASSTRRQSQSYPPNHHGSSDDQSTDASSSQVSPRSSRRISMRIPGMTATTTTTTTPSTISPNKVYYSQPGRTNNNLYEPSINRSTHSLNIATRWKHKLTSSWSNTTPTMDSNSPSSSSSSWTHYNNNLNRLLNLILPKRWSSAPIKLATIWFILMCIILLIIVFIVTKLHRQTASTNNHVDVVVGLDEIESRVLREAQSIQNLQASRETIASTAAAAAAAVASTTGNKFERFKPRPPPVPVINKVKGKLKPIVEQQQEELDVEDDNDISIDDDERTNTLVDQKINNDLEDETPSRPQIQHPELDNEIQNQVDYSKPKPRLKKPMRIGNKRPIPLARPGEQAAAVRGDQNHHVQELDEWTNAGWHQRIKQKTKGKTQKGNDGDLLNSSPGEVPSLMAKYLGHPLVSRLAAFELATGAFSSSSNSNKNNNNNKKLSSIQSFSKSNLTLCSLLPTKTNELKFLQEWLIYHKLLGIDKIIFYDFFLIDELVLMKDDSRDDEDEDELNENQRQQRVKSRVESSTAHAIDSDGKIKAERIVGLEKWLLTGTVIVNHLNFKNPTKMKSIRQHLLQHCVQEYSSSTEWLIQLDVHE
ncbi:hypothetical protein OIO90_001801 [Microbotryomycetes sp. JL221]|nr:hypothetical protein OIO90_001801 [Microbotryomycetes sp. JL221]